MLIHKRYNLVFYGEIVEGYSVEEVRQNLASDFDIESQEKKKLFAGKPAIIRKNVDRQAVSKLETACEMAGAVCQAELVRIDTEDGPIDVTKFCNVEFQGKIAEGHNIDEVKQQLATLLNTDRQTIEQLFTGKPVVLKQEVDYQTALDIQRTLQQMGAICRVRSTEKNLPQKKKTKGMICPKCGFEFQPAPICPKCGIIVKKYGKKKPKGVQHLPEQKTAPKKHEYLEELQEETGYAEENIPAVEEELEPKLPGLVWSYLIGTIIVAPLISLIGLSLWEVPPQRGFFPLFLVNLRVCALVGLIFPCILFCWNMGRTFKVLRSIMIILAVAPPILSTLTNLLLGNIPMVLLTYILVKNALKIVGFSAIIYGVGFGLLLVFMHKKQSSDSDS